jgi:hypothetical protein
MRISVKSPSIPLHERGKLLIPPFGKRGFGGISRWSIVVDEECVGSLV